MAWRPTQYLIEGELDNTQPGKVTGWMQFAGMTGMVTFSLEGDFHRDIRGAKIHLKGDASETNVPADADSYMDGFASEQTGKAGNITAGQPPADFAKYPYVEWYGEANGRVVIELEPIQVEVIGTPIPASESDPIAQDRQDQNMAEFLGTVAEQMNLPAERVVCVSRRGVIRADKRAASDKTRGMKLLTKELRRKLPPLYSQEEKGGKAVVHMKLFTPDSSFTWYITEGSPVNGESGTEIDFHFFGLVDGQYKELGYVSLRELESVRGPMGLPIERDLWWQPKTLEEIAPEVFRPKEGKGESV